MNKIKAGIVFVFVGLIVAVGAMIGHKKGNRLVDVDSGQRVIMGTFVRIIAVAGDERVAERAIEAGFGQIRLVDELMSTYKEQSEISRVNREGFGRGVKVGGEMMEVLGRSIEYSKLTGGAFDVTVGPMIDLWKEAEKKGERPGEEEIAAAKAKVGYEKLFIDANEMTLGFSVEGMEIDLGAIAKGYAIDKAVEAMMEAGAEGAMVDAGGDIRCWGVAQPGRDCWQVGLQDPGKADQAGLMSAVMLILKLDGMSVATSGDYQRFEVIDGKKYSHIIDRDKGAGSEGLCSVTVICEKAADADALATSVSVLGTKKGMELIESLENTEAILIEAGSSKLIKSSGVDEYIVENLVKDNGMFKTYEVCRAEVKPEIKGNWDGDVWGDVEEIRIDYFRGDEPEHKPDTRAKLLYDDDYLYVIFRVEDKYLLASAEKFQDKVCVDSCVEFFFTPNEDISTGYFNIEMNCGGTVLCRHQMAMGVGKNPLTQEDFAKMEIYHSEDKIINPERVGETTWVVEYKVPLDVLSDYTNVDKPASGVKWRANFYKCADATSKPHWLMWSVIDSSKSTFHSPEYFGTLKFK